MRRFRTGSDADAEPIDPIGFSWNGMSLPTLGTVSRTRGRLVPTAVRNAETVGCRPSGSGRATEITTPLVELLAFIGATLDDVRVEARALILGKELPDLGVLTVL